MQKFTAEEITNADLKIDENRIATYIIINFENLKVAEFLLDKKAANIMIVVVKTVAANEKNSKEIIILRL